MTADIGGFGKELGSRPLSPVVGDRPMTRTSPHTYDTASPLNGLRTVALHAEAGLCRQRRLRRPQARRAHQAAVGLIAIVSFFASLGSGIVMAEPSTNTPRA